ARDPELRAHQSRPGSAAGGGSVGCGSILLFGTEPRDAATARTRPALPPSAVVDCVDSKDIIRPQIHADARRLRICFHLRASASYIVFVLPLQDLFGEIDIYLFDQILRGRITPGVSVLDAGCGYGRNLVYFLHEGYTVFAADADPRAIEAVRGMAPHLPATNFRVEPIEAMTFLDASADAVLSSALLHFA